MTNGLILFLNFLKKYRQIVKDEIIQDEQKYNNQTTISYTFRKFNLECYIIDKKYFDDFCSAINFYELSEVLKSINEETKDKCKEILKKLLVEKRYIPDYKDIIIYAEEEKMKTIVKKFNNYSFVNKELLIDCMGIPEERLKSKKILLSKNENNTSLLNIDENYVITLNIIKKPSNKENEEKKLEIKSENESKSKKKKKGMNNLYYVEDITKKIFILLFKQEELLQKKIQKEINDVYNFKNYFLINKEWLKKYKESFLYDNVIGKLDKDLQKDSYKKIKTELDDIVKNKIGQIKLNESGVENFLKDSSNLIAGTKLIKLNDQNKEFEEELETKDEEVDVDKSYNVPFEFEIINEDIYELLKKEEFLEKYKEEVENKICFQILLGKEQIIIKNKLNKQFEEKNIYSNELLFYEKTIDGENNNNNYKLQYILSYEKKVNFFKEIEIIIKNDLEKYLIRKNIKLGEYYTKENILDEKSNVLGKIININIKQDLIEKVNYIIENKINNYDEEQNNKYRKINSSINFNRKKKDNIEINEIHFSQSNILDKNNIKQNQDNTLNYKQDLNFNKNEIKNNEDNNINLNDIIIENEKIEININDIKKIFDNFFKNITIEDITKNVIDNSNKRKTQTDLSISGLRAKEIDSKIKGINVNKIVIMDEDEFMKYREMFDFNEMETIFSKYKNEKNNEKKINLLEENKELIKTFINSFDTKKLILKNDFQLIMDYKTCIKKIKNDKKFFFLNSTFVNFGKRELVYHFQYKLNNYIYFKESQKIFKVINKDRKNDLYNLEIYEEKQNKEELINTLIKIVTNNKSTTIEATKIIKEYYIINDKWIQSLKNQKYSVNENLKPKMETDIFGNKFPVEFDIICKDENEYLIQEIKKILDIKEDFIVNEMIVLKQNSEKSAHIFIGIIKGSIIYFYLLDKQKYNINFLIKFSEDINIKKEIKEKIITKDIKFYLNFMTPKRDNKLFDIDFQKIGELYTWKNEKKFKILDNYNNPFIKNMNKEDKLIQTILACLANVKELKDYIPQNKSLIKRDSFLFIFFQIIRIMWSYNQKYFEKYGREHEQKFVAFMCEIEKIASADEKKIIFANLKLLIGKIILQLQKDLYKLQFDKEFIFEFNQFQDQIQLEKLNDKKTFLQDLFFFNIEISDESKSTGIKEYFMKYYLDFDIKKDDPKSIELSTIFYKLNQKIEIDNNKTTTIQTKFISLPKYLIIIINNNIKNKHISMIPNENLDIKEFCKGKFNKTKYNLLCIIGKNFISYCKSPVDSKWYHYDPSNPQDLGKKGEKLLKNKLEQEGIRQGISPILMILKQT